MYIHTIYAYLLQKVEYEAYVRYISVVIRTQTTLDFVKIYDTLSRNDTSKHHTHFLTVNDYATICAKGS